MAVHIEKFIRILPANLHQYVYIKMEGFDEINLSVKTYEEMTEINSVGSSMVFMYHSKTICVPYVIRITGHWITHR